MKSMFEDASSFNQDLCAWKSDFPYEQGYAIFQDSACTFQDSPQRDQQGPFCASSCDSSSSASKASSLNVLGKDTIRSS